MIEVMAAIDKFLEAKRELSQFTGLFEMDFDGEFYTYRCPECGVIFYRGVYANVTFTIPVICCNKILSL